ncbi:MAG: cupin domain-containing protein [Desulfobacterales bacterium]|nr:cupin domain-containing protein [Desulfobacterales bacterium]
MGKKVIRMDSDMILQAIPQSAPECITDGDPQEKDHTAFMSEDGMLTAGVWESTAGTIVVEETPVDEFCYIISGNVEITNHVDDSKEVFKTGDAFFMPKGIAMTWHVSENVRKYYVIREYK